MPNVIPPQVPGPVAGQPGHFPHHDWLTAAVLALDVNVPPAWTAWTPALQGSTTNPTLGTGAVALGRYARIGKLVVAQAFVQFGTAGVVNGSGSMRLTLPFTLKQFGAADIPIGQALMRDSSASVALIASLRHNSTDGLGYVGTVWPATWPTGTLTAGSFTSPWTWAASDSVGWSLTYETGDP